MKPRLLRSLTALSHSASLLSSFALLGCSDDVEPSGEGGAGGAGAVAERFLASTNVPAGDDYFTLIGYLQSLESRDATLLNETEHPGFAGLLRSSAAPNAYFVGSGESPTIRRFDYDSGQVIARGEVSFANLGLAYAPGSTETAFDEDGFAYSLSVDQALVVVWNVETMEIDRTIEIPGLTREGFASVYPLATILRDGTLLAPISYTNWDSGEALPLTVLLSVEVGTDEVTLAEDERCSGIRGLSASKDGTLYGATDGFFAVRRRLYGDVAGTEPCILRVLPGERRFDEGFELSSRALFDASIVGDLTISEDGDSLFFNVYDEDEAPIPSDAVYADVARAPGWRVYRAPLTALTESSGAEGLPIPGLSIGARQGVRFNVSGRSWVAIAAEDYASSQLFDISAETAVDGPRFNGSVSDLYEL